jgi:exonuclease VII small subunit
MSNEKDAIEMIEQSINLDMPSEQLAMVTYYNQKRTYLSRAIKLLNDEINELDNAIESFESFESMSGGKRKGKRHHRSKTKTKTKKARRH